MNPPVFMEVIPDFKPGDPPPLSNAYCEWMRWAEVQDEAGIKQKQCPRCRRWWYPQENHDPKTCRWSKVR